MSGNDDERSSASPDKDSDCFAIIDFLEEKYPVAGERPNQDALHMNDDAYREYTSDPYVNILPMDDLKMYLAFVSNEFMSAACLLPSNSKLSFYDPSEIQRYEYLGNNYHDDAPIWSFRAKYFYGPLTYRFNVEEIDISRKNDSVIGRTTEQKRMAQRLYMLHYFKHDNLLSAYFTLSEPWIYRLNTALPNNVSLKKVSDHLEVGSENRCPSIKYVAICILRALEYLHESNIVHKNVSIENCFYDLNGNVLLGGFENTDICGQEEEKSYDIWNVGTTLLDYCFDFSFGRRYPDPTCSEGYPNLFRKMLCDRNKFEPDIYTNIRRFATEEMYRFLLRVFQRHGRLTAAMLLEKDKFVGISEDDFKRLKSHMAICCRDLRIKSFCENVPISTLHETIKPLDVWKEKSRHHFVYKMILPSVYRSDFQNSRYQFKNGSEIKVDFTIVSQIYDGSYTFNEVFKVGDEKSIFKALLNVIKKVDKNSAKRIPKILHQNGASRWWYPLHSPRQFFFAWDIFRLRAALDAILSDAANCKCGPFGKKTRARRFPLCHHKKGISRHVDIEIHYSPTDIIKIKQ